MNMYDADRAALKAMGNSDPDAVIAEATRTPQAKQFTESPHIVATGGFGEGFTFYGPFANSTDAECWAETWYEANEEGVEYEVIPLRFMEV